MELKQLEYFVRVAEMGSLTKAALLLSVEQPALSKQIRSLEVELRRALFLRNGRGVSLTEQGVKFLNHAIAILEQVRRASEAVTADAVATGKVVIATPPTAAKTLIRQFITAFRNQLPGGELEIIEEKSRVIYEWLLMGRIDIGIMYDPPPSRELEISSLCALQLFLISLKTQAQAKPGAAITFRKAASKPLILPALPHSTRALLEAEALRQGVKVNVILEMEGAAFNLSLVQGGHGSTVLLESSLRTSALSQRLQANPIIRPKFFRTLKVATSAKRPPSRITHETVRLIRQHLCSPAVED